MRIYVRTRAGAIFEITAVVMRPAVVAPSMLIETVLEG